MLNSELTALSDQIRNEPQGTHANTKVRIADMFQGIINSINRGSVYVEDFGQIGIGNDRAVIQTAIDYCLANSIKTLNFRATTYSINGPLIVARIVSDAYTSFNLDLVGSNNANAGVSNQCTRISCTHTDTFGIGFQNARSCTFSNILLVGGRSDTSKTSKEIFEGDVTDWVVSGVRDTQYSPYAGIVVDPFGSSVPSDGGYPGLSDYYKASAAGSSGVSVRSCYISNFTVGFLISPNGTTANAESINLYNSRIYFTKISWASGQSQTRACRVVDCSFFYCLTAIDTVTYGAGIGSSAVVDTLIISKARNCVNVSTSRGNIDLRFIYAEDIWKIGVVGGDKHCSFRDCTFKLNFGWTTGIFAPDTLIGGNGRSIFYSCDFSKSGDQNWNTSFNNQSSTFYSCNFDGVRNGCFKSGVYQANYYDSRIFGYKISQDNKYVGATPAGVFNYHGNTLKKTLSYLTHTVIHEVHPKENDLLSTETISLTVDSDNAKGSFTSTVASRYKIGDIVYTDKNGYYFLDGTQSNSTTQFSDLNPFLGTVESINGDVVTIKDLRFQVTSGTFNIFNQWTDLYFGGIMGTTTNGSNVITNVYKESSASLIGQRIFSSDPSLLTRGLYVVSEDTVNRTLTISGNLNSTQSSIFLYTAYFDMSVIVSTSPSTITGLFVEKGTLIRSKGTSLTDKLYLVTNAGIVGNGTHTPAFKEVTVT